MPLTPLTAITPLDGRYSEKTKVLRDIVSEYGLIFYRLQVEIEWLVALSLQAHIPELSPLSQDEKSYLMDILSSFNEVEAQKIKQLESTTNHDVKAIEYYLREKLQTHKTAKRLSSWIHFACTSEDISNLAYGLMVKTARDQILMPELKKIIAQLNSLAEKNAALPMLSRTHGQPATPTTLGKEFKNMAVRLESQLAFFSAIALSGKCNGAVGNFNAHVVALPDVDWPSLSKKFVESLGLTWNAHTTQIEPHDQLAQFLNALSVCHTILIDCCRDLWGYIALDYFTLQKAEKEVGSSTMPHKINPIDFENAEGNLGLAIALSTHLSQKLPISRWQRDLSDSTVMRNIGSVFGYALIAYQSLFKGLNKLIPNKEKIREDLTSHWEILAEPIQMVMRRYGIEDAYEQLKSLSRGEQITQKKLHEFIETLKIPTEAKKQLTQLTPENYIGLAVVLTNME